MKILNKIIIPIFSLFLFSCVAPVSGEGHTIAFILKYLSMDTTPPKISFTSPTAIDDEYEINRSILVVFTKTIFPIPNTPVQLSLNGTPISGSTEFVNNSLIFKPSTSLEVNTEYSIKIQGVEDIDGNQMEGELAYTFKTESLGDTTPISIKEISPSNEKTEVELDTKIAIEFNEALNPKSVRAENFLLQSNGVNIGYTFEYVGNILFLKPNQNFSAYTYYTLTISRNITDTSNLPLGADYTTNFITGKEKDISSPTITESYPEVSAPISPAIRILQRSNLLFNTITGNEPEIEASQFLLINFSEAIQKTIPNEDVILTNLSTNQKANFGIKQGLSSITVFPMSGKWDLGQTYKLTIRSIVSDLATNDLSNGDFELPFRIAGTETPPTPPQLAGQIPANTEQNVGLKVKIRMIFTKPVFRPSVSIESIYIVDDLGNVETGTYSIEDNKTILFTPANLLKPLTAYTAHVKTKLRGMANEKLTTDYTFTFTTEEFVAPSGLAFNSSYYKLTIGNSTPPISPSYSGYVTSCSITPTLPSGMFILPNCTIYGSPKASQNTIEYTITASNTTGSTNTKIFIGVTNSGEEPFFFSYPYNNYSFVLNDGISTITPFKVGSIISCTSTPALPAGLSLTSDCKLEGTPLVLSPTTSYSILASSGNASMSQTVQITVSNSAVNYPFASYTLVKGVATTLTPTVDASTYNCSISPALPSGLALDTGNCKISGVPSTEISSTGYTVTANSSAGVGSTSIFLAVRHMNSCKEILDSGLSSGSGVYQIDADGVGGQAAFRVYCDMTTDGGGWTLGFLKNTNQVNTFDTIVSNYTNLSHLEYSPEVASQMNLSLAGWLNGNVFSYTNMRISAYDNGVLKFISADIPKTSLRINFGQSGYFLNGSPNGYFWCGGIRNFTDFGTYEDNPVSGTTTRKCKVQTGLGSGFDFSTSNTLNNQGITLHGSNGLGNTLLISTTFANDGIGSNINLANGNGALAFWFR